MQEQEREQRFSEEELEAIKQRLERRLQECRGNLSRGIRTLLGDASQPSPPMVRRSGFSGHSSAYVTMFATEGQGVLCQRFEKALIRLEAGWYGICESCGDDIPQKRLDATDEAAITCATCQEAREPGPQGVIARKRARENRVTA